MDKLTMKDYNAFIDLQICAGTNISECTDEVIDNMDTVIKKIRNSDIWDDEVKEHIERKR